MIASLPMYDRPEVRGATDRFWQAIRTAIGHGPYKLTRDGDLWDHWQSPDLLLSQTCGYPYRARLHGKVRLVGTPDYGLEECGPGEYRSVFVARRMDPRVDPADFAEAVFAYNEPLSQSGWAAPGAYAEARGFRFSNLVQTGGHQHSAKAVAEGRADLAALDVLSWKMMKRYDAFAASLHVIDVTTPTPVLPYITSMNQDPVQLYDAVATAIGALSKDDRDALSLHGLVSIPAEDYIAVPSPAPPAS